MRKATKREEKMNLVFYTNKYSEEVDSVINRLFDFGDLKFIKSLLREWMTLTVTSSYNSRVVKNRKRRDVIYLYDLVEGLIEAIYYNQQNIARNKQKSESK